MRTRLTLIALVLVVGAGSSSAQEAGSVGLTMAFPASVGVIWHASDKLAIRPDFIFSQSGGSSISLSTFSTGIGVSALLYVRQWDGLRMYVSPRFSFQRTSLTSAGAVSGFSPTTNAYGGAGSFGAEYQLHQHFSLFAETGIAYTHSHTDGSTSIPGLTFDTATHTWGTRAGIGAIVYF